MTSASLSWEIPLRRGRYLDGATGAGRLVGLDAARGLAIVGMMVAHMGVTTPEFAPLDGLEGWLALSNGRSSILFSVIAGFSVGILSGRARPYTGDRLVHARLRILVRAALLLVLAAALEFLGTPIYIILGQYAFWFALSLPFLRWRPRHLLGAAAGFAAAGPVVNLYGNAVLETSASPWLRTGNGAVTDFLFGAYPGVVWMAYILAGLALSRIDWDPPRLRRLLGIGVITAVAGYGSSLLLTRWFPATAGSPAAAPDPRMLLVSEPHSDTLFEVLGSGGVAVAVVAALLLVPRRLGWTMAPLAALGSMSLTSYSLHVVAFYLVAVTVDPRTENNGIALAMVLVFLAGAMAWKAAFARGPLEHWMYAASVRATTAVGSVVVGSIPGQPTPAPELTDEPPTHG